MPVTVKSVLRVPDWVIRMARDKTSAPIQLLEELEGLALPENLFNTVHLKLLTTMIELDQKSGLAKVVPKDSYLERTQHVEVAPKTYGNWTIPCPEYYHVDPFFLGSRQAGSLNLLTLDDLSRALKAENTLPVHGTVASNGRKISPKDRDIFPVKTDFVEEALKKSSQIKARDIEATNSCKDSPKPYAWLPRSGHQAVVATGRGLLDRFTRQAEFKWAYTVRPPDPKHARPVLDITQRERVLGLNFSAIEDAVVSIDKGPNSWATIRSTQLGYSGPMLIGIESANRFRVLSLEELGGSIDMVRMHELVPVRLFERPFRVFRGTFRPGEIDEKTGEVSSNAVEKLTIHQWGALAKKSRAAFLVRQLVPEKNGFSVHQEADPVFIRQSHSSPIKVGFKLIRHFSINQFDRIEIVS